MEEDQEMRFVCKLCDKRYPSGKSLGGHMRTHMISASTNSAEFEEGFELTNMKKLSSFDGNGNGNGNSNYGLRENPKKTWRASMDSSFQLPQERICKQCGKGFQSLKALCGHMACHSEKEKGLKDYDHSWTSESQKEVMDSHSDTEAEDPTRVTRSKSKRYKKINVVKKSSFSLGNYNNNNSSSNNYGSSSVTEIDELEQEEVAMCLMMLSKDSGGSWVGVNSIGDSSDNNSVVLETKSSSNEMRIGRKDWNCDERLDFKKGGSSSKLKGSVWDGESVQIENSNSGYYRNGVKRVESDDSIDEIFRKGVYKKSEVFDNKFRNGFDKDVGYERTEFDKNLLKEKSYNSRKRVRDESLYDREVREESVKKKKNKYECMNCNKIFSSFQGLGGHRPCHKKANANFVSRYESGENSIDDEIPDWKPKKSSEVKKKIKSKKVKAHECPICFRLFKSGQALGGHKRSHFLNGCNEKFDPTPEMEKDLIDLNLPAPEED